MDQALANGSASGVYTARDALVERYADLAQDRELIARMTQANDLIRRAVKVESTPRAAAATAAPRPARPAHEPGPPVVGRRPRRAPPGASRSSTPWPTGSPTASTRRRAPRSGSAPSAWPSPFAPQAVPGEPTVLVVDARHDELLRLDARTGQLVWRLELGEPVESPPLVLGDQLFQALPSGKLLVIDLQVGRIARTTVDLGLPLSRAPVSDESGRFLYVVGPAGLPVRPRPRPAGLRGGRVPRPRGRLDPLPARPASGRFLIVAENDRPADGRWRVLVLDEEGARLRPVQQGRRPRLDLGDPGRRRARSSGRPATRGESRPTPWAITRARRRSRSLARLNPDAAASGPGLRPGRCRTASSGWRRARPIGPVRARPRAGRAHAEVAR